MSVERIEQTNKESVYFQTINALIAAAGQRDKSAEGHSERVSRYCFAIGKILDIPNEELANLKYAASLHDIGKIAISRKIINKLGKLTSEEFEIMKQHSTIALRILEKIDGLENAIPMVKHHHERFDGRGYPDGLAGENIPLGSRIIAVAEAFDILTSNVPWRDAMDQDYALGEIEACKGTQFDPNVVVAFREAISSGMVEL